MKVMYVRKTTFFPGLLIVLLLCLSGCPQTQDSGYDFNTDLEPDVEFNFSLDKTAVNKYVPSGANFIPAGKITVTATNTGEKPLSIKTSIEGYNNDIFSISPKTTDIIPADESREFTIEILIEDPWVIVYTASITFESGPAEGSIKKKVDLMYTGMQFQQADISFNANLPFTAEMENLYASTDDPDKIGKTWFSSNSEIASIDAETGKLSLNGGGEAIIGFWVSEKPPVIKGAKIFVLGAGNEYFDIAPFSTVTASTEYSASYTADKVIDGNPATRWASVSGDMNSWLQFDFTHEVSVEKAVIYSYASGRLSAFYIDYMDGSVWKTIYTGTDMNGANPGLGPANECQFPNSVSSKQFRLRMTATVSNQTATFWQVQLLSK